MLQRLISGAPFDPHHQDHPLKGSRNHVRDCHVRPDLVLRYELAEDEVRLRRPGTHSDLFE